jgi:hypothetical protein
MRRDERQTCRIRGPLEKRLRVKIDSALSLDIGEWSSVFGKADMATASLERMTDHCHLLETGNES